MKYQALTTPDWLARSAVYQINPRTFSREGTLKAVEAELPFLASLGFGVMYLCPIFEADSSCDRANWSDRQKKYGTNNPKNPYRMNDYFSIDEEYGTMDDLRAFIAESHRLGMRVILDLVYAHIGPNAHILKTHPEFAQQDADGSAILSQWHFPYLDFTCPGLREYLWSNMVYYISVLDADGFRCDVGDAVPLDFWAEGRRRMQAVKPDAILINEGNNAHSLREAFDSMYCFDWHEALYSALSGSEPASLLKEVWTRCAAPLPAGGLLLRDADNHDTVTDWPERVESMAGAAGMELTMALNYAIDGIPMIYCGNELCDRARINMFANRFYPGSYEFTDRSGAAKEMSRSRQALLAKLNEWKRESDLLRFGKTRWLSHSREDVAVVFERAWQGERLVFIGNLSSGPVSLTVSEPLPGRVFLADGAGIETDNVLLEPHGYIILTEKTED